MYEVFEKLCQEKGIKPSRVAKDCGIANSTFSDWKAGRYTPKTDKMVKIAKYFEVSLEMLLGV